MTDHIPERERYSLVYGRQGPPERDSQRMRTRLGALIEEYKTSNLYKAVLLRLGVDAHCGRQFVSWRRFGETVELRDLMDTVSVVFDEIQTGRSLVSEQTKRFLREVNLIFQEEHVTYRADDRGVVRLTVDQEFEWNRTATIAGLGRSRFANAMKNFEEAHDDLSKTSPDGKGAIRAVFDAAENVFKVMFPKEPRLTAAAARTRLTPVLQKLYSGNGPATAAASKQLDALCNWVDGAQNYRHEHNKEEVIEPPIDIAVLFLSTGAANIRWLIGVDAATNKAVETRP
jgi:hypothetical protein